MGPLRMVEMDSQSATQAGSNGLKRGQTRSDGVKQGQGDDRIGALRDGFRPQTTPKRHQAPAVANPGGRENDPATARRGGRN